MAAPEKGDNTRITVRLWDSEVQRLDRLVALLNDERDAIGRRRWPKPPTYGRRYEWTRGDVVRRALSALESAIAASDEIAAVTPSDDGPGASSDEGSTSIR